MYERFAELLKAHNVSSYEVAKKTGLSNSFFSKWKKGTEPKVCNLYKVAAYFGVDVSYLLAQYK